MFENFKFTEKQLKTFHKSAQESFKIAKESKISEVSFDFGYKCLVKLAIIMAAKEGLRVKSHTGHHKDLIEKLAEVLKDKNIIKIGDGWRIKRNSELYFGGPAFSPKEAESHIVWLKKVFMKVDDILGQSKKLF
jgi:hypothetical protein